MRDLGNALLHAALVRPAIAVFIIVFGTMSAPRDGRAADATPSARLADALKDCTKLKLPNSMAREPGFDLEAYQKALESRYRQDAQDLASAAGVEAIRNFLATHRDDLDVLCAVELAGMTRRSEAKTILEHYTDSEIPGVSEIARKYLAEQK
jgi:hypothetical protein